MAGPGDEIAAGAGSRSQLRASHADREQVIEVPSPPGLPPGRPEKLP